MNFDFASSPDPWQLGWEALAAIGTLLAVLAALYLPWKERHIRRTSDVGKAITRTRVASHEIAVDLNEIHVHMMESLRIVLQAMNQPPVQRTASLDSAVSDGFLQFPPLAPNLSLQDLEWLVDDVRQEVARMKGQIYGFNRQVKRIIKGPFAKFPNANASVVAMFPTVVRNLVALQTQCLIVMRTLKPYLSPEFDGLETSMTQQARAFEAIGLSVDRLDAERTASQSN